MSGNTPSGWRVFHGTCKDCGEDYHYSDKALRLDTARGWSPPERCPACRKVNAQFVNSQGAAYWKAPREHDPAKMCFGKMALGRRQDDRLKAHAIDYSGEPASNLRSKFEGIDPAVQALIENLEHPHGTRVSILVGPTGSGKSVWSTYRMLRSRLGQEGAICVTQPRLVTLRSSRDASQDSTTPGFISRQLLQAPGVGAGQEVGYLYRGESTQWDRYTRLLFVTDGVLIRWLVSGEIGRFSVVVIDEAHEQSRNMELIFALLRYKLPLYPRLRVVIASATVDIDKFRTFFGNGKPESVFVAAPSAATVSTPKQIYDRWPTGDGGYASELEGFTLPSSPDEVPAAAAAIVRGIRQQSGFTKLNNPRGDVLIFVPTVALVKKTINAVGALKLPQLEVLPCHAQMTASENTSFRESEKRAQKAFAKAGATTPQRVIVATNYAETSVTFSNLTYVIDSGYIMEPRWSPETCSREYPTTRHSQAGCTQRKGRVGRVQDGEVFRLYTEKDFYDENIFSKNPIPAIAREPVDMFLLTAKAAGVDDLSTFSWMGFDGAETIQKQERERALRALRAKGAIAADGELTNRGVEFEGMETDTVDLALALSESDAFGCSLEIATFLAFLDVSRDLFLDSETGLRGYGQFRAGCYDDLEFYLRLFYQWEAAKSGRQKKEHEAWSLEHGLNHAAFQEVSDNREGLLRQFTKRTHTSPTERELDIQRLHRIRLVIMRCLPEWIYVRDAQERLSMTYVPLDSSSCPCKIPVAIDRDSTCVARDDIDAFVCLERRRVGKALYAKHVVRVKRWWLKEVEQITPAGLALLGQQIQTFDRDLASRGHDEILSLPKSIDLPQFLEKGDTASLRFVRALDSEEEGRAKWCLLECLLEHHHFFAQIYCEGRLERGTVFRAVISEVNREKNYIVVDQRPILAQYRVGRTVPQAVVLEERSDAGGKCYGYQVQLEPGINALLRIGSLGRNPQRRSALKRGADCAVVVSAVRNSLLEVELEPVAIEVGKTYRGYVCTEKIGDNGKLIYVFVEIAPRVDGMLHWKNTRGRGLWSCREGSIVDVRVTRIDGTGRKRSIDLELV